MNLRHFSKDILAAIRAERYNMHGNTVSFFGDSLVARGEFIEGVNGDWRRHKNLVTDQGIILALNVLLGSVAKLSMWYLAPFAGSTAPAANWTGANFTSNATEIVSGSEGYSEATRRAATFVDASGSDQIDNFAAKAAFTIVTASSLTVTGLGLLSSNTKGGTTGTLLSASKFATARVLQNADVWNAGYRLLGASA